MPLWSTEITLSASPSKANPQKAFSFLTASATISGWSAPGFKFIFLPVGLSFITITSAFNFWGLPAQLYKKLRLHSQQLFFYFFKEFAGRRESKKLLYCFIRDFPEIFFYFLLLLILSFSFIYRVNSFSSFTQRYQPVSFLFVLKNLMPLSV